MNQLSMRFDGPDYSPRHDQKRLAGQMRRIFDIMKDGEWLTLAEIAYIASDPEASVSAQLRHLRKERFGGNTVEKRRRGDHSAGLFEYRLIVNRETP